MEQRCFLKAGMPFNRLHANQSGNEAKIYFTLDVIGKIGYHFIMIRSFTNKMTRLCYEGKPPKQWRSFVKQAEKRLQILDSSTTLDDLRHLPSNHFKALTGQRKGQYSIRINKQWRICFTWVDNEPDEVEIVDYH